MTTMNELKEKALVIGNGFEVYFPQWNKHQYLRVDTLKPESHKLTYAYKDNIIAFVDEEAIFYVIPDLDGVQKTLLENGYEKDKFYVPLHDCEVPFNEKLRSKWEGLLWEKREQKKLKRNNRNKKRCKH